MPTKRTYKVRISKDFLVLGGFFFFLCLWAIKDGWYPSEKTLKKHPRIVEVSFKTSGMIDRLYAKVGDSVGKDHLLAELCRTRMEEDLEGAKKEYTASKKTHALMQEALRNAEKSGASGDGTAKIKDSVVQATTTMEAILKRMQRINDKIDASELTSTIQGGKITKVLTAHNCYVEAGETVLIIDPQDHFYSFNKSLSILSFFASFVFFVLHFFGS